MSTTLRVLDPFVVGLQFGRIQSPAALAVLERVPGVLESDPIGHELRYLLRWGPETTHLAIVRAVVQLFRESLPARYFNRDALGQMLRSTLATQTAALVVNATGVGRAAFELLRDEAPALRLVATWVTAGDQALEEAEGWRVPQRDLVAAVQVLRQQDRLDVAEDLSDSPELRAQMDAFHVVEAASGRDRYDPTGGEDLVLALALACWWSELVSPGRIEVVPGEFSAWSKEALEYDRQKRRIKPWAAQPKGPMAEGVG